MSVANEYWNLILCELEGQIQPSHYKAWFGKLGFVKISGYGKKIILQTYSKFAQRYLEEKYKTILLQAVQKYYPRIKEIEFEISEPKTEDEKSTKKGSKKSDSNNENAFNFDKNSSIEKSQNLVKLIDIPLPGRKLNNLNPKYTFDNLVATGCNQLATSIAKVIADKPGQQYNPVFIYSNVGLGKTHILNAIGQKTLENFPSFNIKYMTSESFMNQYIEAVTTRKMREFNAFYREIDLLLVDDIQFIAGKEATQEAFYHIFNQMQQNNKQIVISSDRHPDSLAGLESRLVSRLKGGFSVDISAPTFEDRKSVLDFKNKTLGLNLSPIQIETIATRIKSNFRDMEGILTRIQASQTLFHAGNISDSDIDQILAGSEISSIIQVNVTGNVPTFDQILNVVARTFNMSADQILSLNREKEIMQARQLLMYILKVDFRYTLGAISKMINKNHSTVLHSINKCEKELATSPNHQNYLNIVRSGFMVKK